jgi:cell division protein FtsQ
MARETKKNPRIRWRLWFSIAALLAVCASTAMAALKLRQFVTRDARFTLSRERRDAIAVIGLRYASLAKVQRVFAVDFDHSVFSIPLDERRRRLLAVDWVENASVSRLWPDRLAVRIQERKPVAFVLLHSSVLLIDAHGVLLEPPPRAQFTFPVLSGIREDEALPRPEADAARLARVRALLRVEEDLGYMAKDVSEVNAANPENIRILAQVDNRPVELILGNTDFGRRYQNFVSHYPEILKTSPAAKVFDLRLDGRITAKE